VDLRRARALLLGGWHSGGDPIAEPVPQHRAEYAIWDSVLCEKVKAEPNGTLLLNCSVCEVEANGERIRSVRAWHLIRQRWVEISAAQFIDCSGDSILRMSGAAHHWGGDREAYRENLGVSTADRKTMGNSVLVQLREIYPKTTGPSSPWICGQAARQSSAGESLLPEGAQLLVVGSRWRAVYDP